MADINRPRPFLEQHGAGFYYHQGSPPLCYIPINPQPKPFVVLLDLDDAWADLASASDMVAALKPQRDIMEGHMKRDHARYLTRVEWGMPQVVWYYLGSGKAFAKGHSVYEAWVAEFNAAGVAS